MAGLLPPVVVTLIGNIDQFTAKMGEASAHLDTMQSKGATSMSKFSAFGTASLMAVGAAAVGLGTEAIHLADAFEVSHARLTASLTANGTSFDQWSSQVGKADQAGQALGYTNAQIEDGLANLEIMVKNPAAALKDLAVAEDVARARGMDLTTAAQLVGKASDGTYTSLVRLGVVTAAQAKTFKSGSDAVQFLATVYAGQASAAAETFAGKLQVLEATGENLGKNLGLVLIPIIENVASALSDSVTFVEKHKAAQVALAAVISALVLPALGHMVIALGTVVVEAATAAWTALEDLVVSSTAVAGAFELEGEAAAAAGVGFDAMLGPIGLVVGGLAALYFAFGRSGDAAKQAGEAFAGSFTKALGDAPSKTAAVRVEIDKLNGQIAALKPTVDSATAGMDGVGLTSLEAGKQTEGFQAKIAALNGWLKTQATQSTDTAAADAALADATGGAADSTAGWAAAQKMLAQDVTDTAAAVKDATTATNDYFDAAVNADRADINWADKARALTDALKASGDSISNSTAAGSTARGIVDDLVVATQAQVKAELASGDTADQMRPKIQGYVDKLDATTKAAGLTKQQIDDLHTRMGLDSGSVNVDITANAAPAEAALAALKAQAIAALTATAVASAGIIGGSYSLPATTPAPFTGRAVGGPVAAGQPYIVGEKGPEMFVPTMAGTIMTNAQTDAVMAGTSGAAYTADAVNNIMKATASGSKALTAHAAKMAAAVASAMVATASAATIGGVPQAGPSTWTGIASQVANMLGQPGSVGAILRRIQFESGGNPSAVNRTDSNWQAGHPSVGLAQVISGTFAAYANQFKGTGPFAYGVSEDPLANVYAGMNYATHRYGSIAAVDPLIMHSGYDTGGWLKPGMTMAWNGTGAPERVVGPGGDGVTVQVIVQGNVVGSGGMAELSEKIRAAILRSGRNRPGTGLH